jgi:hypothetical protein
MPAYCGLTRPVSRINIATIQIRHYLIECERNASTEIYIRPLRKVTNVLAYHLSLHNEH